MVKHCLFLLIFCFCFPGTLTVLATGVLVVTYILIEYT